MSLPNRFLRPPLEVFVPHRGWFIATVLLWLAFSYTLFVFAHAIREVMRLFTAHLGLHEILIYKGEENSFYLFFTASMALSISFGLVFRSYIVTPSLRDRRLRRQKFAIYTDLGNLNVITLWVLAKVGFILAATGSIFLISRDIGLYENRFLMLGLPIVVFCQQWSSFNRLFYFPGVKWMCIGIVFVTVVAFCFSKFPLLDPASTDRILLASTPASIISYELPKPQSEALLTGAGPRTSSVGLIIGFRRNSNDREYKIFSNAFPFPELDSLAITKLIQSEASNYGEFGRTRLFIQLAADKNVPMREIKKLRDLLSKTHARTIYFTIDDPFLKFSPYRANGYGETVPLPRDPEPPMVQRWSEEILDYEPAADVVLVRDTIFFNGETTSLHDLYDRCRAFVETSKFKGALRVYTDDDARLDTYLKLTNEILRVYHDLRDEVVQRKFHLSYRDAVLKQEISSLADEAVEYGLEVVPDYILRLTDQEKDLLLTKRPHIQSHFPD